MTFISRISILFTLTLIIACKSQTRLPAPDTFEGFENALLWQIEGNGLEEPSWIFGTIHLISSDRFFWPAGTLAAFDAAESIVFEVDLDDMSDMGKQFQLLTKAFMPGDMGLADLYTEEEYEYVRAHFEDMGIPMFILEKIKPMFLTVFAGGDIEMGGGLAGNSHIKSYEMELYSLASDAGKPVEGLESLEYQMSVFDSIPYKEQADMLLETIRMADEGNDMMEAMEDMYVRQLINDMVESMEGEGGIAGYEDLLLYDRNANWIPVMGEMMRKNQVFFAVGAGHLGGQGGVLDLLQKAGYRITPLSHSSN